jgi:2-polyprenyl-6-methoxyphenol hydroxylase-like FAD-dependent oxidoreductase
VLARLKGPDGAERACEADYLAGCDGARSRVRERLGAGFPGGTYAHLFYVADAEGSGPVMDGELHVALDESDFLAAFPMKGGARAARRHGRGARGGREALAWEDVGKGVLERLGVGVERVNWFSTYRVHHRVADRFRRGRAFLLGDAAHIHSPVGGQGHEHGIADAVNLAWKLAAVLRGRAPAALLDSYEPERIAFARRLVATTDRVFTAATSPGRWLAPSGSGSCRGSSRFW